MLHVRSLSIHQLDGTICSVGLLSLPKCIRITLAVWDMGNSGHKNLTCATFFVPWAIDHSSIDHHEVLKSSITIVEIGRTSHAMLALEEKFNVILLPA